MSFILDALKKSENERQRQSGPALFEVKVATPRAGLPLWAVALAGLLVVNIGVVVWLVLRKPAQAQTAAAPLATAPAAAPTAAVPVSPTPIAPLPAADPVQQPAESPPVVQSAQATPGVDDAAPINPEDYEPAVPPGGNTPPTTTGHVTRSTMEGLPSYEEAAARSSLPEMRLDMHVYAAKPQERFVFINMQRLREGDVLPNGVRVEQITPGGVVLSHQGAKFVLERE